MLGREPGEHTDPTGVPVDSHAARNRPLALESARRTFDQRRIDSQDSCDSALNPE